MFLGMQDFWFCPNLIKFATILITVAQIRPNFAQRKFPRGAAAFPAPTALNWTQTILIAA